MGEPRILAMEVTVGNVRSKVDQMLHDQLMAFFCSRHERREAPKKTTDQ